MEPEAQAVYEKIKNELANNELAAASARLEEEHPADAADILMALNESQRLALVDRLEPERMAAVFNYLDSEDAADIVIMLDPTTAASTLDESDPDVAADVLGELTPEMAAVVLERMEEGQRVAPLLLQPAESAGGVMTPEVLVLDVDQTVEETLAYLRAAQPPSGLILYLFVVDSEKRLLGVVSLRDIVVAPLDAKLETIMDRDVISVRAGTDQEEAARLIRHYDLMGLPVVDEEKHLLGTITFDDAADVLDEEATEDIFRQAGMSSDEQLQGPFMETVRRRAPWLLLNLFTAFLSAYVVHYFAPTIGQLTALAVFMPVIAGHGGNTGTQVVTLVIRSLSLGELHPRDTESVLVKEVAFGLAHGLVAGAISAAIAFILIGNPWLGLVVAAAMMGNVLLAVIIGALLPMLLRAVHLDPALMSSIFLTTITDVGGFIMLLGLAAAMMPRLLGG